MTVKIGNESVLSRNLTEMEVRKLQLGLGFEREMSEWNLGFEKKKKKLSKIPLCEKDNFFDDIPFQSYVSAEHG